MTGDSATHSPDGSVQAAWQEMLEDSDRIADQISSEILARDSGAGWLTLEVRTVLQRSMREHVHRGLSRLAGLLDQEGRSTRMADVWRATGMERARQGVPLESVLSAYTTGNLLLWESLAERVRTGRTALPAEQLVAAGRSLWRDLGTQSEVVSEAYRRQMARQELRDLRRQENYLAGLLEGRGAVPDFAAQSEEILGIRSDVPIVCVLAIVEDTHSEPLQHPEDRIERRGGTSRWGVGDGALYGVVSLQGVNKEWVTEVLHPAVEGRVGMAVAREGIAGAAAALRLAGRAAATLPAGERRLVWASTRLPELLLESSPELGSMIIDQVLGPVLTLPAHQRTTLLQTLEALLRHEGSPTYAAEELFCHRNTVNYRSRQLADLTECDLQNPRDRLLLQLAVIARHLAVASGRDPS